MTKANKNQKVSDEYLGLAKAFEEKVAEAYFAHSKANAKKDEKPSEISIEVTNVEAPNKPRVRGDLKISFKIISGSVSTGPSLMNALTSTADAEGTPRSFSSMGGGFVTHLKPKPDLFK